MHLVPSENFESSLQKQNRRKHSWRELFSQLISLLLNSEIVHNGTKQEGTNCSTVFSGQRLSRNPVTLSYQTTLSA